VNHKMTHICKFKPRAFALKAGDNDACSDLLRVGEIHQWDPQSVVPSMSSTWVELVLWSEIL
jgi:hypothetical protein